MLVKIKQKLCANVPKKAPQQLCRQRTIENQMTSNNLQSEIDFQFPDIMKNLT